MDLKLIDTNILIYAINLNSKFNKSSRVYLSENVTFSVIADQNINEALRLLTHEKYENKLSLNKALRALKNIQDRCISIHPNSQTSEIFIKILSKYNVSSNRLYDAYLVATMYANGIKTIVTANEKDFIQFPELKVINPFKS